MTPLLFSRHVTHAMQPTSSSVPSWLECLGMAHGFVKVLPYLWSSVGNKMEHICHATKGHLPKVPISFLGDHAPNCYHPLLRPFPTKRLNEPSRNPKVSHMTSPGRFLHDFDSSGSQWSPFLLQLCRVS